MDRPFRTIVDIKPFPFGLGYKSPALFLGSCFTENIGTKMQERKFPVMVNPYGVLYNPLSVGLVLKRIIEGNKFDESELNFHNNLWFSFMHHTSFSSESKTECLQLINSNQLESSAFWGRAQFLIATFGTARVYYHKKMNVPVANCHKIPAKEFKHKLLSVNEIVDFWGEILTRIFTEKPNLKVILTVSPIRHWKDGAEGNQQSKSTLILAVHELVEKFSEKVFYFPAYEIMMDELRDYRFYADDMLHPSNLAIDYIWERFRHSVIFAPDQVLSNEIEKVLQNLNHRPFKTNTKEFSLFLSNTRKRMEEIKTRNPIIDFSNEEKILEAYFNK